MFAKNCLRLLFFLVLSIGLAAAQDQAVPSQSQHVGQVHDWTSSHVLVSGGLNAKNLQFAKTEPRVLQQMRLMQQAERTIGSDTFGPFPPRLPGKHTIIDGSTG